MTPRKKPAVSSAPKAMRHQLKSLAHDMTVSEVLDTSDAGTGKTFVRIIAFAQRRRAGGGKLLVLAPKTLLRTAWENDFKKFAPDMKVSVAEADNRQEAFDAKADVYITNHDAVKWCVDFLPDDYWNDFSELVIDEPTAYKNKDSQRSKAAAKVARRNVWEHRAGLTMTPTSNGICDIWHQVYLLDGGQRLGRSFYNFRAQVCTPVKVGRHINAVRWEDKDGAEEAVFSILQDMVIRHKLQDCVDIPPTFIYDVPFKLPKKVQKAYDQMELTQLLSLRSKGKVKSMNAVNAAAVATKLLQICSGAVYSTEDEYHLLDTSRYDLVLDMVEQRKHSLVFFQWKHQRDMLLELAEKRGITHCVMDGTVTQKGKRVALINQYQAGHFQVMFAHPKTAAHGLTLTKGTSTIWPGPTYDLELWKQGNARQARIGQKEKTEVVVIIAKDTIEEKVYELLMGKHARMKNLLDLMESMV